jgi:hypothetical protein
LHDTEVFGDAGNSSERIGEHAMKKLLLTTAAAIVLSIPTMAADSQAQKSAPYPVKPLTEATPDAGMKKGMMKEEGTVGAAPSTEKDDETPTIRYDRPQQNDPEKQ